MIIILALRIFTSIVYIRSITVGIAIPIVFAILKLPIPIIISTIIAGILIIVRNRDNLIRIMNN